MLRILKRMPKMSFTAAVFFLVMQVICDLNLPKMTAAIVNNGIIPGRVSYILFQGALMVLISAAGLVSAEINTYLSSRLTYKLGRELRSDIFKKVLSFTSHELDEITIASLITRNTNDVTQVQTLAEMGLKFLIMSPI